MEVHYVAHMGDDLMVVNAARVSFAKESDWERTHYDPVTHEEDIDLRVMRDGDVKLINYLASHGHWTPFSHPQITLRIKAPVFVRTQLFKHKVGFTENEVSRRYVDEEPEFFMPIFRQRPDNGMKQGSKDEFPVNYDQCEFILLYAYQKARQAYDALLKQGVAPEQARMVLPQAMYTEWYWTGSLAAYARVCKQRLDAHAQSETREIAKKINDIIEPLYPVSWKALT